MSIRSPLVSLAVVTVLVLAACNDGQMSSAPQPPPPVPNPSSTMLQGNVDGATGTVTFTPVGMSPALNGVISPAIYGAQGSTVTIFGKVDSTHDIPGTSRVWFIRLALRNMLTYAIGSNYSTGNTAPPDTSGVFVFKIGNPAITLPVPCPGCTLTLINAMGTRTFTAANQQYFWYNSRPDSLHTTIGADTTTGTPQWQFQTTPFSGGSAAQNFTFVIEVSAAWSPPGVEPGGAATILFDGARDTLPDVQAEPRWRKFAVAGQPAIGTESWTAGNRLNMAASTAGTSIYMARRDSLGSQAAFMQLRARGVNAGISNQFVFGLVEPAGGKQAFVTTTTTSIGFATFTEATGVWTFIPGQIYAPGGGFSTNSYHTYALRKVGTTSYRLCVDGTERLNVTYASQGVTSASFTGNSVIFGTKGSGGAGASSRWTSVAYKLGSDNGGC